MKSNTLDPVGLALKLCTRYGRRVSDAVLSVSLFLSLAGSLVRWTASQAPKLCEKLERTFVSICMVAEECKCCYAEKTSPPEFPHPSRWARSCALDGLVTRAVECGFALQSTVSAGDETATDRESPFSTALLL